MKRSRISISAIAVLAMASLPLSSAQADNHAGKKVLFIDSYHSGYEWSDGIVEGIRSVLDGAGVELKIHRMDTKRNGGDAFKKAAGLKAKEAIESYKPDVVIACDDNASKYLIQPFYKDAALPIVFCGVKWDASQYGFPYKNVTGMIEVGAIEQLVAKLKPYAKGTRIGFLTGDTETERKEAAWLQKSVKIPFASEQYAKTFAAWKDAFKRLQGEVDILLVSNNAGIADWDEKEAAAFAMANTQIPSGTTYTWMMPYSMMGLIRVPEEQGQWSAHAALKILEGASPGSIAITPNKRVVVHVNPKLAARASVVFDAAALKGATVTK